jgi:uncharacterized membrane protein YbhN (UPF0104 family)
MASKHDRTTRRLIVIVMAAAAFGVAMSVFKGNDTGIRDDIGNLSAPWLLLAFFAGAAAATGRRGLAGAAAGLAATFAALIAFNVANAFVLDLGPHSLANDVRLAFTTYWFPRALLSGPVFGALGAIWRRRGYPTLGVAVILLLDAEPLFWAAVNRAGGVSVVRLRAFPRRIHRRGPARNRRMSLHGRHHPPHSPARRAALD